MKKLYVEKTGDDSIGNGTNSNPYLTIQKAVNMAVPGTTVLVGDGVYKEKILVLASGCPDAPIKVKSKNKLGAHIQYDSPGINAYIVEIRGSFTSIEDFEISGDCPTGIFLNSNNTLASGNNIHGMGKTPNPGFIGGAGVLTANDPSASDKYFNMNVIGNVIHDTYGKLMLYQGIYIEHGGGGLVQNNIVYNINNGTAIETWHSGSGIEENPLYISNNLTWNTAQHSILVGHGDCYPGTDTDYVYVTGNIIIGPNGLGGLAAYGPLGENIHFINNIIWNDTISPFDYFNENDLIVYKATPIMVTGIAQYDISPVPADRVIEFTNTQFISEDPFVNFKADGTGDYHLKPGSPYINAGVDPGILLKM